VNKIIVLDRATVARLLPRSTCFGLAVRAFQEVSARRGELPNRLVIPVPAQSEALLSVMAGVLHEPLLLGAKISAVFPDNRRRGLAGHNGAVILFDADTGSLAGLLHGGEITARRTAAATAVATSALARRNSRVLALIGAGEQASHHLEALLDCIAFEEVRIWSQTPARAHSFAEAHSAVEARLVVHDTVENAVRGADVICTLTSASDPVLFGRSLEPGQHVNAVGSSVRQFSELDADAVRRSKFYADYLPMAHAEGGDYLRALASGAITAEHVVGEVGEVLLGRAPGRTSDQEITLFKSLGVIAEDLTAAQYALAQAAARNLGAHVSIE
jgi:ornithine cyclodeaminase/alanine dehydrogenase-like protein (mu-crystallin family)